MKRGRSIMALFRFISIKRNQLDEKTRKEMNDILGVFRQIETD